MLKSSLLEIIRTFTKQELAKFEDFVRSPYFNKKENVLKLFLEIKKYSPSFTDENLEKEKIWVKVFPGKEYNYGIMKNLIFDLTKLVNKFIELENYSDKKFDSDINLLEQYFSRKLFSIFEKKVLNVNQILDNEIPSSDIYYKKYILAQTEFRYLIIKCNVKEIMDFDFRKLNNNLSLSFFTKFFSFNVNMIHYHNMYNIVSDNKFILDTLKSYNESEFKNYYSEIFYRCFIIVNDPFNEDNYNLLKSLYYENFDKLTDFDKYCVTIALHNFCMNNSNKGNVFYVKERYQYNKILADNDLLLTGYKDRIDRYVFMTTVIAACGAGEFDWCRDFIEKYKVKLEPKVSEQFVNFAYIQLNFKMKNYEKALEYLSKCDNAKAMDKVNIKTFQFYLYYELKYYEELKNLADTSKHFITNDKTISAETKLLFNKFIEAVIKLSEYRYKTENGAADVYVLSEIKSFVSENSLIGKNWLNEKISELDVPVRIKSHS